MRREPHPFSGAVYEEIGDGLVRVDDNLKGKSGIFKWDGTYVEGSLTYADPHFLFLIGGPDLPPGKDIFWTVMPPVDDMTSEFTGNMGRSANKEVAQGRKIIAPYVGDPGTDTPEGKRSASHIPLEYFIENDQEALLTGFQSVDNHLQPFQLCEEVGFIVYQ